MRPAMFAFVALAALSGCRHRDDARYLQGIINAQAPTGRVHLPKGVYRLKRALEFPSTLKDIDGGNARLIWAGGYTDCVLRFGYLENAVIHDFNTFGDTDFGAPYCLDTKGGKK